MIKTTLWLLSLLVYLAIIIVLADIIPINIATVTAWALLAYGYFPYSYWVITRKV